MHRKLALWIVIVSIVTGAPALLGQGRGKGPSKGTEPQVAATKSGVQVGFGIDEQRIIVDWFSEPRNLQGLPPGLAKREQLPPGLQKQLVRNGHLPPGLEKKIEPLPPSLEAKLPRLPDGHQRIFIGGNIILTDKSRSVIIDIFAAF